MESLLAGRIAEARINTSSSSKAAEGAIEFGKAVKRGTNAAKQIQEWDGANSDDQFAGIAVFSYGGDVDNEQYKDGDAARTLEAGVITVKLSPDSGGVSAGDQVEVRDDGYFDTGLSSATNGVYGAEIENSEFLESGSAGDVVKARINLPGKVTVTQL
jgi:hypothetical protein